ncbi:hypothetical protein GCM10009713_23330 [Brevibacterium celere]
MAAVMTVPSLLDADSAEIGGQGPVCSEAVVSAIVFAITAITALFSAVHRGERCEKIAEAMNSNSRKLSK